MSILLVDDDPGGQRSGYEVTTAALEAGANAAILCDMRMPNLDGPDVYRELARRQPHLASHVMFLTGDVLSPEAQDFFAQIDNAGLTKPRRAHEVRRVTQQVLAAQ